MLERASVTRKDALTRVNLYRVQARLTPEV